MRVAIIGLGAWGTALGEVLSFNGHSVIIYGKNEESVKELNSAHTNSRYFHFQHQLSKELKATSNLKESIENSEAILIGVPTSSYREVLNSIEPLLDHKVLFISVGKGFDPSTHERLSSLIREIIPEGKREPVVSLLGPSFAQEVVKRDLTCLTAACVDEKTASVVQKMFSNDFFRVYVNTDEIGCEYAAAIKNVIALASGIILGLGYSDNARAALVTRGLNELARFGVAKGGEEKTFYGLSGVGDLTLTCSSLTSRNFQAGLQIGKENSSIHFLQQNKATVEGIKTSQVIYNEAQKMKIDMPIVQAVYTIIYETKTPSTVIKTLMNRSLKKEF